MSSRLYFYSVCFNHNMGITENCGIFNGVSIHRASVTPNVLAVSSCTTFHIEPCLCREALGGLIWKAKGIIPTSSLGNETGSPPPHHFPSARRWWRWKHPRYETTADGSCGLGWRLWGWKGAGDPRDRPEASTHLLSCFYTFSSFLCSQHLWNGLACSLSLGYHLLWIELDWKQDITGK